MIDALLALPWDTRRVYEELLGCAERSIWASTYAFFDGPRAFDSNHPSRAAVS
jgi:hypothetical protein